MVLAGLNHLIRQLAQHRGDAEGTKLDLRRLGHGPFGRRPDLAWLDTWRFGGGSGGGGGSPNMFRTLQPWRTVKNREESKTNLLALCIKT
jgi:hypothetical protein